MHSKSLNNDYVMPPEWLEHDACWMAWPCRKALWPDLEAAFDVYAQVANAIVEFEPVRMLVNDSHKASAQKRLNEKVDLLTCPLDDSWSRDTGPSFVIDNKKSLVAINWQFNGWGQKFVPYQQDANIAQRVANFVGCQRVDSPLTMEGGAFHVDGKGSLMTTMQCALNNNRNKDWDQKSIEQEFRRCLGVENFIWLERGLVDDHTDGHVDELACFAGEDKIVALSCEDRSDANYDILKNNLETLRRAKNLSGDSFKIHTIHQPEARFLADGSRMSLSYINYYHANNAIIMAAFGQSDYDSNAFEIINRIYPEREIIQINAMPLFEGGGGIHCITQQQPRIIQETGDD